MENTEKCNNVLITRELFEATLQEHSEDIAEIRESAYELHKSVNQFYGNLLPYGHHLDMVVNEIRRFGHLVTTDSNDVLPMIFSGYYHDSIEDARQTYNDVMKTARRWLTEEQALTATEIVYALTNDKGRNRAERAGEKYYEGIRQTPYAPFVKLCDRLANVAYSCISDDPLNMRMKQVYIKEMPHFLNCIAPQCDDPRRQVPEEAVRQLDVYLRNSTV